MRTTRLPMVRLLFCFALLFLNSCNSNADDYSPPNEISRSFEPMNAENLATIEEIGSWQVMDEGDPISLVAYNLLLDRLTAVSEQSGTVTIFEVESGETIFQNALNTPNFRALKLDEKGEILLGAKLGQMIDDQGLSTEYLKWAALWSTNSGLLNVCISGSCITEEKPDPITADIGASMDLKAQTVVEYSVYGYTTERLSENGFSGIALVNSPDADYWWHIGAIAIDSQNERMAIVFQEGRIQLEKLPEPSNWPLKGVEVLEKGEENQLEPIHHAIFDQQGNWLAFVRGKELSIWNVSSWIKKVVFHDQIDDIRGMSFNPAGELLFIGVDAQIRVIGLKEKKAIHEIPTPGITSLNISADNRLLFWGDENGTVHVWGIP